MTDERAGNLHNTFFTPMADHQPTKTSKQRCTNSTATKARQGAKQSHSRSHSPSIHPCPSHHPSTLQVPSKGANKLRRVRFLSPALKNTMSSADAASNMVPEVVAPAVTAEVVPTPAADAVAAADTSAAEAAPADAAAAPAFNPIDPTPATIDHTKWGTHKGMWRKLLIVIHADLRRMQSLTSLAS
jgi:hypothetical protein